MSLIASGAVLTDRFWLPRLVEGLKAEDVSTPREHTADGIVPVGLGIGSAGNGCAVVGATGGWPAGLTGPELDGVERTGDGLDLTEGLLDVVEVCGGCVVDGLALPVCEAVRETVRNTLVSMPNSVIDCAQELCD